jgi:NhaP-type Na+/H+ or K+/H+ antiporter
MIKINQRGLMLETIGTIVLVGMLGQWISWILKIPVVIILLLSGFVAGPVVGLIDPNLALGEELIHTIVELCVALILFDGAMQLKISEFKEVSSGLKRILSAGVVIHFILISFAAHYIMDFSLGFSALMGGILIVTGPTVIIPALREAKLNKRIGRFLKWEGILTDPVGAIIAVVIYDAIVLSKTNDMSHLLLAILKILLVSFGFSYAVKKALTLSLQKKLLPEYLQVPIITSLVICSFVLSNEIQKGSGLLTVTILGMLIGNSKIDILIHLRTFKEHITTMSISFVFILIAASVPLEVLKKISMNHVIFILLVSFVLRLVAILLSTINSRMSFKEKILVGSYGPRGIVAASVAAVISSEMMKDGIEGSEFILPIIFLIILTTVITHGLFLRPLTKLLGLTEESNKGVVFIGTMPWVIDLAEKLKKLGVPVLITSASWYKLAPARKRGIPIYYGQLLDAVETDSFDISNYSSLVAMSANDSFNLLACEKVGKYLGPKNVFHLPHNPNFIHDQYQIDKNLYCVFSSSRELLFENLMRFYHNGWGFKETRLTEKYSFKQYLEDNSNSILCMVIKKDNGIIFGSSFDDEPCEGDVVISYSEMIYTRALKIS